MSFGSYEEHQRQIAAARRQAEWLQLAQGAPLRPTTPGYVDPVYGGVANKAQPHATVRQETKQTTG